ncbi:MAG: cation transporter [Lentisphaeria bacterium]|nr:cation transporter [Lentisphaeria bacterium]
MLTALLLKLFVPGLRKGLTPDVRLRCGMVSGVTGIFCNVFLAIVKFILAALSGSIAIAADAVNNLSDAGSGVITVAGFRLSSQPPDAEHPFGHGRTEYVAGLAVAMIVVGLGITFLKDSIMALFSPGKMKADTLTVVIFTSTVLVKCWLFFFYRKVAKMINSDAVKAAAYDSLCDCLGTVIVIGALIASRYTALPLDGCAGIVVALMILWAGVGVLKDTVSKLLGEPPPAELVEKLRQIILSAPGIDGVHDIIIHNYGENIYYVTAHAEIACEGDRFSAHDILENAEVMVGRQLPVHLLLHGDPYNKSTPEIILWRSRMENTVAAFDSEFKLYDFRLLKNDSGQVTGLTFHLLIPHRYGMTEQEINNALKERMSVYTPDLSLNITFLKSFV